MTCICTFRQNSSYPPAQTSRPDSKLTQALSPRNTSTQGTSIPPLRPSQRLANSPVLFSYPLSRLASRVLVLGVLDLRLGERGADVGAVLPGDRAVGQVGP